MHAESMLSFKCANASAANLVIKPIIKFERSCSFHMFSASHVAIERMAGHMQEERLAAEKAAHIATEEAIRKAELQAAQKAKQAGNDKQTLDKSQQANLPPNLSVWSICDSTVMAVCS